MTRVLTQEARQALASDLIQRAETRPSYEQFDRLLEDFTTYENAVARELTQIFVETKAAGRDRPHADAQGRMDKIKAEMGGVQLAIAEAKDIDLQGRENRLRVFGPDTGGGERLTPEHKSSVVMLPSMREYRAMSISGGEGLGGALVDAGTSAQYFDRLRPESVVLAAGPRVVTTDSDRIRLPKLRSSVTVYNPGEAGTITASDPGPEKIELPLFKYTTRTVSSSEFFEDANPSARAIVQDDHRLQLAAAVDADMLGGNAAQKLVGMRRQSGVTVTELGAGNGAAPALTDVSDAIYRIEADDAKPSAIFMHPRTWNVLKKLLDGQNRFQLQPDPTKEARRSLFGLPVFISSQISIAETVGGSTDCSYIIVADMSRVVVVRRDQVGVLYDPFSQSATDQVVVQTTTRWGFGLLDEEAVEVITGVRT